MDNCNKEWEVRPPAKLTLEKLNKQDEINFELHKNDSQFDKIVSIMQKDIETICESLKTNTVEHLEIKGIMKAFIESADKKYVNYDVFSPIRKLVYGATGVILTLVLSSLIYLIIKQ